MCGIAGKVYLTFGEIEMHSLRNMTNKLVHRGPDGKGYIISKDKKVGLAHTRLSIIDLTDNASQPMCYMSRYYIVFNGEIYNFIEERENLKKEGYRFKSRSDTEVLLALYSKYKLKCLQHLRGMFAFAIYDSKDNTLFLARDRIGKKPLKYYFKNNTFIFASELKAILTQKEVEKKIDYQALKLYLTYGYVPAPLTGFMNIHKLEPGSYIFIDLKRKKFESKRYWQPLFKEKWHLSEKEWSKRILDILEESTKLRMVADVPIGAFLSGGVDSSGTVACMAALSDKPIKTFTITFEDKKFNEGKYAKTIAKMYKTDHYELLAKPESVDILPMLAYQYEEPFANASAIVSYLVSKMAKEQITVVLNGDGADEQFAGYPNRYLRLSRDVNFDFWIQHIRPYAAEALLLMSEVSKNKKVTQAKKFFEKARLPMYMRFASYNHIFSLDELDNHTHGPIHDLGETSDPYSIVDECFQNFHGRDMKDAGLKFDLLYYLPDELLAKVDIASMAVGLEARSPFLDQNMIELSCKIPFSLKIKNGVTKYIEKKALEAIVPKENLYRPKMGFGIPLQTWFTEKISAYASSTLKNKSRISEIIDSEYVDRLIRGNIGEDFGPKLWSLLALELWFKQYFS